MNNETMQRLSEASNFLEQCKNIDKGSGTKMGAISPNRKISKKNKSGVTGVHYVPKYARPWGATIMVRGQRITRYFDTKEQAISFRKWLEDNVSLPVFNAFMSEIESKTMKPQKGQICPCCGQMVQEAADDSICKDNSRQVQAASGSGRQ